MVEHYDLLIRNGTCALPWGQEATDVGVRDGRIAGKDLEVHPVQDPHFSVAERPAIAAVYELGDATHGG